MCALLSSKVTTTTIYNPDRYPCHHNRYTIHLSFSLTFPHHPCPSPSLLLLPFIHPCITSIQCCVPEYKLQLTCVAVPNANPTPLLPNNAAAAPSSSHKSKLTLAPYWLVPDRPFWLHNGFPEAGHKLLTLTMMVCAPLRAFPLLSV